MAQALTAFDLVVIGSGPAGEKAAVKGAYHGKRVAVVEKASKVGGAAAPDVASCGDYLLISVLE